MAKVKKNTIASIMKAIDANKNINKVLSIGEGEAQVEIVVKTRLSIYERADMVNSIANMVWATDEEENDSFAPYLRKFAYEFNILNYFTNISLPDDMGKVWDFIDSTDIACEVIDCVGGGYIENIIREADEAIEYRKQQKLSRSKLDSLIDSLGGVVKLISDKTKNLDMNGLLGMLQTFSPELKGELEKIIQSQIEEVSADTTADAGKDSAAE